MSNSFKVSVCDGKYTYIYDKDEVTVLRYDELWGRDLSGDKFVYALAVELDEARKEISRLQGWVATYTDELIQTRRQLQGYQEREKVWGWNHD